MKLARSSKMAWLMTQCIALLATAPILHVRASGGGAGEQKIRPAAVAGAFYPADPKELSQIAAKRKPSMLLLPYGIPICVGSIAYFFYAGLI